MTAWILATGVVVVAIALGLVIGYKLGRNANKEQERMRTYLKRSMNLILTKPATIISPYKKRMQNIFDNSLINNQVNNQVHHP